MQQGTIYGLPWELYELQYEGDQKQEFMEIIAQSTIKIKLANTDLYQQGYDLIHDNQNWAKSAANFLTTKQWETRSNTIKTFKEKQYSFYTNLITSDNKTNVSYTVENTLAKTTKKGPLDFLLNQLQNTKTGQMIQTVEDILLTLSSNTGIATEYTSGYDQIKNLFKLITREGINMWSGSDFNISNKFLFEFRQYSEDSVESQVYNPLEFLNVLQNPFATTRGGTGSLSITEKVPPLELELIIGNGYFILNNQIIKNMKVEMFDIKRVGSEYKATAATVLIEFQNVKPLVKYNLGDSDANQDTKDTNTTIAEVTEILNSINTQISPTETESPAEPEPSE